MNFPDYGFIDTDIVVFIPRPKNPPRALLDWATMYLRCGLIPFSQIVGSIFRAS